MNEVKIGNQIWIAENLNVKNFRNGDVIPFVESDDDWEEASNNGKPACCYYENSSNNGLKYGMLYNWFALADPRIIAPVGMIIPSINDWKVLINNVGGSVGNGVKLKSVDDWEKNDKYKFAIGTNEFNFFGLPSGIRSYDGLFDGLKLNCHWWCMTEDESDNEKSKSISLDSHLSNITESIQYKGSGFSIRCLKQI
jgi:uncharacterized protein (TIGR02145 family)